MTKSPTLAQQIQRLKELDAKRTPGDWKIDFTGNWIMGESVGGCAMRRDQFMIGQVRGWGHLQYLGADEASAIQDANLEAMGSFPKTMAVIYTLEAKLKAARIGIAKGAIPLEAMRLSGTLALHSAELQQGVQAALDAIAEALAASSLET